MMQTQAKPYKLLRLGNFPILLEYENLQDLFPCFYVFSMQSNEEVIITPKTCIKLNYLGLLNYLEYT